MNMSFAQQTGAESPGKGRRQQPTIKGLSFLEPFGFALAGLGADTRTMGGIAAARPARAGTFTFNA